MRAVPYASVILRKCILLYVITRISLTAALSKYVRAALKDGPVEIHLVDLSSPRNVVVDMSPRSLEELWNNIQGLDQQTAIDALQSWSTPPGFTRNGMVYVHPHAEVHCEAALVALVLGATNRPNDIDSAILRRMPKRFSVGLPDVDQREKILALVRPFPLLVPQAWHA